MWTDGPESFPANLKHCILLLYFKMLKYGSGINCMQYTVLFGYVYNVYESHLRYLLQMYTWEASFMHLKQL